MAHRFSNSTKVREEILRRALPQRQVCWEDFPQDVRIAVLEHIQEIVEEVLNESV